MIRDVDIKRISKRCDNRLLQAAFILCAQRSARHDLDLEQVQSSLNYLILSDRGKLVDEL